jgi:hemerythrin-like metal-binding protein
MALLEWSDELSVGIDIIDKQHMILVRAINLLAMAIEKNSERELMGAIFETLADYTVTHFSYEEELFDHFGYPHNQEHRRQHKGLLDKVVELKSKFDAGEDNLGPEVLRFLVKWLTTHIMGDDKKYSPFLIAEMEKQRLAMAEKN